MEKFNKDSSLKNKSTWNLENEIYDCLTYAFQNKAEALDILVNLFGLEKGIKYFYGYFISGNINMPIDEIYEDLLPIML
jgi:hypothetical protein